MARNPRGPGSTFCGPVGRRVHTMLLRPSAVRWDRSFPMPAKIVINGYWTIGKRVADAVALQGDMNVVGVVKARPDFEAKLAVRKAYALYAATDDALRKFEKAGVKASGVLGDALKEADLVVDCTPEESGYRKLYEKAGVKAIWQGGEDHALTNLSFNAAANYDECVGASFVRVPSCNTTGLIRTLHPLDAGLGVDRVLAVLVRRATDPGDSKKGPINAIEPELEMPSHRGPDVQSVLPKLNIHTIALKVSTTLMHVHIVSVDLKKAADVDRIVEVWKRQPASRSSKAARASGRRRRSWRWPATSRGTGPTSTRSPCGGTASTSSTGSDSTTSRRSIKSRMSSRRTSTRSARSSNSRRMGGGAWRRRTGLSASASPDELTAGFEPLDLLRRALQHPHQRVKLPRARDRAAQHAAEHDRRATAQVRRVRGRFEERIECLVQLLLLEARGEAQPLRRSLVGE